jgi:outer membrane protein assembly factor BamB
LDSYIWFRTSTPLLLDGKLYIASRGRLSVVDATSGTLSNSIDLSGYIFEVSSAPTYANNTLYIPTANKGVIAIDMATFEIVKIYPCGNANLFTSPYLGGEVQTVESSPIVDGDSLIFSSLDGKVNYYDINTTKLIHAVGVGAPVLQAPIFTDDGMITVDFNGYVTKFQK